MINVKFNCANVQSSEMKAIVLKDTHIEDNKFNGTLVTFIDIPFSYYLFLLKYYIYRIFKGISFNLRLPGFASIRKLFVRPVSVMQQEWRFREGHVIFEQGDTGRDFYLVRRGKVDILKTLDTGDQVLLATLKAGDIFGEMAIVGNQPRLATAICKSDCILAIADGDNLDALIDNNPEFTHALITNFAHSLENSEKIMLCQVKILLCRIRNQSPRKRWDAN